ncbi:PREDICTED: DELLA protein RGL1-like [Ipomoea nil]|uniref:DELLA protein RGL1-like n=1 Tax=Ipomoea nil TaxID=35883 RepID=UPI0009011D0A|nr:PREDICTED: DELLA protein RGL1-like [Ipomoea nil]
MLGLNKSDVFGDVENNDDNMKAVKSRPPANEVVEWGDSPEIAWFSSCQVLDQDGDETARKEAPLVPRHKHEHQLQLAVVDCMSLDDLYFDEEASSGQPFSSAQITGNQELSESKRKRAENAWPSSLKLLNNFQNRFRRLTGEKVNAAPSCSSNHDESREVNCCSSTRLLINEVLQLAAHKFIENSSHGDSELNNLFPNSCWGLHGEDYKDVELLLHLLASAEKVGQKKFDSAKDFLSMCDKLSSKNGNLVQRLVYYFSEALRDKVDWQTGEKTPENFGKKQIEYLKEKHMSPKQCILATHQNFPFLQVIEVASVQAVIEHVPEAKKIHIIDLEIRHGMQWTILMQALAAARHAESFIENLRISALVIKSGPMIEEIGKQLTSFADSLKIPFSFKIVKVQDILEVNEQSFEVEEDEAVAVYGQFFFMTMISKQGGLEHLMRVMRTIRPRVMVIIEVEANLNSPVFVNRFTESLFFYSAFLDSLEHFLKHKEYIRAFVEREHLSRSISNIVAAEGEERMIRHVSMNVWRAFFARFGMKEVEMSMSSILQANLVFNNFPCGKYCTLDKDGKSLIIGWKRTPLFSVSAWKLI